MHKRKSLLSKHNNQIRKKCLLLDAESIYNAKRRGVYLHSQCLNSCHAVFHSVCDTLHKESNAV